MPISFNMVPDKLEAATTPRTKAIMPVGIYSQCADMTRINWVADRHGIPVIEDAAQFTFKDLQADMTAAKKGRP